MPEACQYVPSSTFCPFAHPYTVQYSTHPSSIKHQASGAGPQSTVHTHSRLHTHTPYRHTPHTVHSTPQALKRNMCRSANRHSLTHTLTHLHSCCSCCSSCSQDFQTLEHPRRLQKARVLPTYISRSLPTPRTSFPFLDLPRLNIS